MRIADFSIKMWSNIKLCVHLDVNPYMYVYVEDMFAHFWKNNNETFNDITVEIYS